MPRLLSRRLSTTHAPLGIAAVFLHQLYYNDPKPMFRSNLERGLSSFLQDCASKGPSEVTEIQRYIANIQTPTLHIYLPMTAKDIPTHYITLDRDPVTKLWKLMHPKVRAVSTILSYGLIVSWMQFTPSPEIALDIEPSLTTISRGKGAFDSFINTIISSSDYKLTEEAKQCTDISRMFGQAEKGRIAFFYTGNRPRFSGARISFAFDKDNYNFSEPRYRKSVPYPDRPHIRVVDDAGITIVPYLEEYIPDDFEDVPVPVDALLTARLFGYIGFKNKNNKVDVYCLNYYDKQVLPVKIMENRSLTRCRAQLPLIEAIPNKVGYWPNEIMAQTLRSWLMSHNQPWFFLETLRLITFFTGSHIVEKFNERLFNFYKDLSLSPVEIQLIKDYSEKLVELPVE